MEQTIISAAENYRELDELFKVNNAKKIMLVCDPSISFLKIGGYFDLLEERTGVKVLRFSDFTPNPSYESAEKGTEIFKSSGCDMIVAVGGGSSMDVAKCIKLYSTMDSAVPYIQQKIVPNDVHLVAVPTTAGSGSEATRYAVIYYKGEKVSVSDYSCIPQTVLFDPSVLKTLPMYQKKSAMMDALCHSVESYWSVNSTEESKGYSAQAIKLINDNIEAYLDGEDSCNEAILMAANLAGKAINITQTTAGHAMAYKITTLFGCAHGHSAVLCMTAVWEFMQKHSGNCIDPRGEEYMLKAFDEIAELLGFDAPEKACAHLKALTEKLELTAPTANEEQLEILVNSVNTERLNNNPCRLEKEDLRKIYQNIFN